MPRTVSTIDALKELRALAQQLDRQLARVIDRDELTPADAFEIGSTVSSIDNMSTALFAARVLIPAPTHTKPDAQ